MNSTRLDRLLRTAIAWLGIGLGLAILATPAFAQRTLERLVDFDLPGGDYETLRSVPLSQCERACLADSRCAGSTYNDRARWCFLKADVGDRAPYPGATSGVVRADTSAAGVAALPLPDVNFLPPDLRTEAQRLEATIATVRRTAAPVSVVGVGNADALAGRTSAAWTAFGRALLAASYDDWSLTYDANSLSGGAGWLALQTATTPAEQGRALALISAAMERQGLTRPAIEASAVSLAFVLDAGEEQRLDRLRADFGFRVLDYSVDSDTRTPRLCVQTSETIAGEAADLERFVAVDRFASPTVSVEGAQICVEGLEHGERYQVTLRAGLPSVVNEALRENAEFRVYVRDRSPTARFDSNRYVLPATAQGVPVTTVNTDELAVTLVRVNDRNLADVVRGGDFERQLYDEEAQSLARERGAEVWRGTLAVASRRNEEVTTLFPVGEVIAAAEPGVYVLTARPAELADRSQALATQWFVVSDIGLSTYSGAGAVDVFVRSLRTAEPAPGVAIELLARNNAVLATGATGVDGHVRLDTPASDAAGLAPAVVTARDGEQDYAFISLVGGAFELTDRGVAGRTAPGPVDAFLATERGVYRGGETVHLTTLLRDETAKALALPVTIRLTRPDGVVARNVPTRADAAGGVALDLPLTGNAATGTWQVSAHVDPEAPAVGTTSFLVEDYVPQRIEVVLTSAAAEAAAGATVEAQVAAGFLYGAPAADLVVEGSVTVRPAAGIEGFDGYAFGLVQEPFTPLRKPLFDLPRTGADGTARLAAPVPEVPDAVGALEARIAVSVREPGGRTVSDALTLPLSTDAPLLGIRGAFEDGQVPEGASADFEVVALSADRTRRAATAQWTLTRIENDFQWFRRGGRWSYDSIERLSEVASGSVALGAETPARISVPTRWGQYRLEVVDPSDPRAAASVAFASGWVSADASAETPDVLEVHLDRESYAAGETARLRIVPREAGQALVTVLSGSVMQHRLVDVPATGAEVELVVSDDWAPGAYVAATLYRPVGGLTGGRPLPQRAVGIAHMGVDTEAHRLTVAIDAPELARPREALTIPVRVTGLSAGAPAHLTLAAVDVGILNITGYTAPDADGWFLGQRRLGVELRDVYGDLIDGTGATRGRIRTGGDGPGAGTEALPLSEAPVALFSGIVTTDAQGDAAVTFDLPPFNGTLRLMAIVWSGEKVGDAARDLVVRDELVVAGTLPRFLAPGDATRMHVELHNVAGPAGDYSLTAEASGPLSLGNGQESVRLGAGERAAVELPLAGTGVGDGEITLTLAGPDGLTVERSYVLTVRPPAARSQERRIVALSPGESLTLGPNLVEGFGADAELTVSVGSGDLDVAGILQSLDRFPYGCAEQTVSRALPLLYLNEVAVSIGMDADKAVPERIEGAIDRVLAYQSSAGGFGLWSPGTDLWLTAYVMDFLTRSREAGHDVPQVAFESGLDRLQSVLSYVGEVDGERGTEIAYATYVLARNGRAAIGDLRYFAEERLDDFVSPLARAQLAGALAFTGDRGLAERLFDDAALITPAALRPDRIDYGTDLRDAAAIVTLAAEAGVGGGTLDRLGNRLDAARAAVARTYSTQEEAWLLLAANADRPAPSSVRLDGSAVSAPLTRRFDRSTLNTGISVGNDGAAPVAVASTVIGTPLEPLPATSEGLTIERTYFTLDGAAVDPAAVTQNERLLVRLTFAKEVDDPMRVMLTDMLPAGFEIENPRLVGAGDMPSLPSAFQGQAPEHTEFRDDRFAAAWTLGQGGAGSQNSVTYMVRAVSPGTFTLPPAEVSDMYQPRFVARTQTGTVAIAPTR